MVEAVDLSNEPDDDELRAVISEIVAEFSHTQYLSLEDKVSLGRYIYSSVRGLDILQELVEDQSVTEIMVNGYRDIFIEREGRLSRVSEAFDSKEKLEDIIQKIAAGSNRAINEANPIVDARLSDGSRVNMILPPVAVNGPVITIRKFPAEAITMEKLIEWGSVSQEAANLLQNLVISGYNIFISGGTGTGKTTFLNALSNYIPASERIITIEDSAELQLKSIENLVSLEVRNANVEGKNEITIRDLIKTSLRMRPSRIIVGEVRDAACIDMLQAMNTGHNGMSTGHANSPTDMLSRLETMVLLGGAEIPLMAVRRQIASAIDIIIHLGRFRDRSRRVVEITEVCGFEGNEVLLNPLFRFEERGEEDGKVIGALTATGNRIIRRQKLAGAGL